MFVVKLLIPMSANVNKQAVTSRVSKHRFFPALFARVQRKRSANIQRTPKKIEIDTRLLISVICYNTQK